MRNNDVAILSITFYEQGASNAEPLDAKIKKCMYCRLRFSPRWLWSVSTGMKKSEEAVPQFDEMMNAGQCQKIYHQSELRFNKKLTVERFCGLMESMHHAHGNVVKRVLSKKVIEVKDRNTIVVLVYCVKFAYGKGIETFKWNVANNQVRLSQYDSDFTLNNQKAVLWRRKSPYSSCPNTTVETM